MKNYPQKVGLLNRSKLFLSLNSSIRIAIAVLLFSATLPVAAQTGWNLIDPSIRVIRDMESNGRNLYAVGDQGLILKRNAGVETIFNPGVTTNFTAVTLIGANTILAVGADKVARSTDGGTTWNVATIAGVPSLNDIIMENTNSGWTVGAGGKIFKTVDGGVTWTAQTSNTTNALNSISFNGVNVIAVGANRTVCRSTNGGTTWTVTTPGSGTNNFHSVLGTSLIVSTNGLILKSTDNGLTWTTKTSGTTAKLNKVTTYYIGPGFGRFICGDGGVTLKSADDGETWVNVPSGRTDNVTTIEGAIYYEGAGATLSGGDIYLATSTKGVMISKGCGSPGYSLQPANQIVCVGDDVAINYIMSGSSSAGTRLLKRNGAVVDFDGNTNALNKIVLNNIQASQAGTYVIEVTSPCGNVNSNSFTITVNDAPAMPSIITGSVIPVQSIITTYSVANIAGNTYAWTAGTGAQISPSANTATISWTGTGGLGSRTIAVTPTSACGTGPARTLDVNVQAPVFSPVLDAVNIPVNSNFTIDFGSPVQLTNTKTISIVRVSDNSVIETYTLPSANVTTSGGVVTINPTANLANSINYRIHIDGGSIFNQVTHTSTYPLGGGYAVLFRFTTAAAADGTPPTISSYAPVDNATAVAVASNLVATFSENINPVATKTVSIKRTSDNSIFESYTLPHASVTVSGATVTINPTGSLASVTGYYVNMDVGAFEDAAGNDFAGITNNTAWNFTTADVIPPTITTFSPVDNATDVAVAANLVATFSENVTAVATKVVSIKRSSDNAVFESYTLPHASVTVSGTTVTINPTGSLANSVGYYVNIEAGAFEDAAGNDFAGISNTTFWSFTTVAGDITPPTAISFSPVDNATSVAVNTNLVITFSENVSAVASKIVRIYRLSDNEALETYTLPDAKVVASGSTVTINPSIDFLHSTEYYVFVESGAFEDIAGNDYAGFFGNTTWNFTSAAPADGTPPTLISLSPADNSTGVPVSSNFVVTFSENVAAVASKAIVIRRLSDNNPFENFVLPNANVTISGTTVTINPSVGSLVNSLGYYFTIEPGAFEDLSGNDFAGFTDNATWNFTTEAGAPQNQTITFNALSAKTFGDASLGLSATASSGLTVSYSSSNTAVATISGSTIIIVGAGSTTITASQAGNGSFNPAPNVQQTLTINKANQTITFGALAAKTFGDANFTLGATASSSLGVSYSSSNTAVATVSGNTVTIVGVGSTTITSSQAGNTNYNAAADVQQTLTVNKANQTITFGALAAKTFGDANFTLGATASSSLGVSYTSSNTAVATVSGNSVMIVGAGSTTITASQTGNANFNAAANVQQTLTVNKANQTITFGALAAKTFGDANFALGATASSSLGVSYTSSNTAVATVSGNSVTIVGAGSTTITASQTGNTNFNAAANVQQTLTVNKANQTITFNALPGKQVGDAAFALTAVASSGLAVSYASSNTAVATISGSTVTIVGAGSTTITASQAGNANFNAATNVQQTLTVTNAAPAMAIQSLTPSDNATNVDGTGNLAVTFNQNVNIGAGTISIFRSDNDALITSLSNFPADITISGATVTFNFPVNIPAGVGVYVNISAGYFRSAADGSNTFAGISNKTTWNFAVAKLNQTITFGTLAAKIFGDTNFDLSASASSGLAVSYSSSNTDVATISGSTVTIVGTGSATITASQSGNATYNSASNVQQVLTVNKANQVIAFNALAAKTFGDANFALGATANSGLGVSYTSSNTSIATVSGNTVTIVASGSTTITASQAGNVNFNAATNVQQVLTVNKADQTITFNALAAKTFGDANFILGATASSALGVSYTSNNTVVATVSGNTVTVVGVGSAIITASQGGNANINSAPIVQQTLTVNKADQTVSFTAIPAKVVGDAAFGLSASTSTGLAITFTSSNTSVATVSGTTVTIVGAGTSTITALQAGNANYNSAFTDRVLTVSNPALQNQTITFNALSAKTFGDAAFALSASATSGLTVTFASSNTSVATISGNTVTIVGAGTTTITAQQIGNGSFNAAPVVQQVFTVNKATQTLTFGALSAKTFGDVPYSITATSTSGLPISFSSSNTAVATVAGNMVSIVGAGSATITASQGGDANYQAATAVIQSLTVNKANQTVTFGALATKGISDPPFSLSATASSGLTVSYTISNESVATISGTMVTLLAAGTAIITASQGGNSNYKAATEVTQSITIINNTPERIISITGDLKFDDLILFETATKTFTISNTGNDKLNITSIVYPEGYSGDVTSGSVAAMGSLLVTVTFAPTEAKDYSGEITIQSDATSGSSTLVATGKGLLITAITNDFNSMQPILLYPNPARDIVSIEIDKLENENVPVIDGSGRLIASLTFKLISPRKYQAEVSHLPLGIYYLRFSVMKKNRLIRLVKTTN